MKSIRWNNKNIHPSKIVCIGRNYAAHIEELDNAPAQEPVIFLKPNSAIAREVNSHPSDLIHYEGEITFLISGGELAAVGFGLDLTKRDLQDQLKSKGLPWERAKAFDGSAVFSEFVSFDDVSDLQMVFYINGVMVQQGSYELMLSKPMQALAAAKDFLSFEDGDLLMTGTPQGVGPVTTGDQYHGKIFEKNQCIVEATWVAV